MTFVTDTLLLYINPHHQHHHCPNAANRWTIFDIWALSSLSSSSILHSVESLGEDKNLDITLTICHPYYSSNWSTMLMMWLKYIFPSFFLFQQLLSFPRCNENSTFEEMWPFMTHLEHNVDSTGENWMEYWDHWNYLSAIQVKCKVQSPAIILGQLWLRPNNSYQLISYCLQKLTIYLVFVLFSNSEQYIWWYACTAQASIISSSPTTTRSPTTLWRLPLTWGRLSLMSHPGARSSHSTLSS